MGSGSADVVHDKTAIEDKENNEETEQGREEFHDVEVSTTADFEEIDGEPFQDIDEDDGHTGGTVTPALPAGEADETLGVFKRDRSIGSPMIDKLGEVVAKLARVTADTTRDTRISTSAC